MKAHPFVLALLAASLVAAPGLTASLPVDYAAGGTAVIKNAQQQAVVDSGGVVCDPGGLSAGGACVPWGPYDSIRVADAGLGAQVAFQVCIDNDGDGICRSGQEQDRCGDDIFFSHDDRGSFFNPLGKLPTHFRFGCPGGPWKGYVVFLCEAVHNTGAPHTHTPTTGTIKGVLGGTGFGDFCRAGSPIPGANAPDPGKRYLLV